MGFITGLQAATERTTRPERVERVKNAWASLPKDGDSAKVIPLQELDEGSPNYNEKLGTAVFALEHSNPDDFKKNALCTADEGGCYACDQGWYQKVVLYINVLFNAGTKDEHVAVLSKGTGKGSVGKELLSIAADSEDYNNSITDKIYKFARSGSGTDTSYSFSIIKQHDVDLEKYEDKLYDLRAVPFKVAYEKQEAYYTGGVASKPADEPAVSAPSGASGQDSDW